MRASAITVILTLAVLCVGCGGKVEENKNKELDRPKPPAIRLP